MGNLIKTGNLEKGRGNESFLCFPGLTGGGGYLHVIFCV